MAVNEQSNVSLRYTGVEIPLWSDFHEYVPVNVEGHFKLFIESAIQKFNTSYSADVPEDLADVGTVNGPNNVTGMLGKLYNNVSDIGFFPIPWTSENFDFLDFTCPVMEEKWILLSSGLLRENKKEFFALFMVFQNEVWFACLSLLMIIPLFQLATDFFKYKRRNYLPSQTFQIHLMNTFRLLVCEPITLAKERLSTRISSGAFMIGCFLLNMFYTKSILSKVTLPPKVLRVETLNDVLNHQDMKFIILEDTSFHWYMRSSEEATMKKLYEHSINTGGLIHPLSISVNDELENIFHQRSFVVFPNHVIVDGAQQFVNCDDYLGKIYISKLPVFVTLSGFPMRKSFPKNYSEKFKHITITMKEMGLLFISLKMSMWTGLKCFALPDAQGEDSLSVIAIDKFALPFYAIFMGYFLGLLTLVYEFWYQYRATKKFDVRSY